MWSMFFGQRSRPDFLGFWSQKDGKGNVAGWLDVAKVLQILSRIIVGAFCPRSAPWVRFGGSWSIILAPFATHFGTFGTKVCISGARWGLNAATNGFTSDFHGFCWPGRHPRVSGRQGACPSGVMVILHLAPYMLIFSCVY